MHAARSQSDYPVRCGTHFLVGPLSDLRAGGYFWMSYSFVKRLLPLLSVHTLKLPVFELLLSRYATIFILRQAFLSNSGRLSYNQVGTWNLHATPWIILFRSQEFLLLHMLWSSVCLASCEPTRSPLGPSCTDPVEPRYIVLQCLLENASSCHSPTLVWPTVNHRY